MHKARPMKTINYEKKEIIPLTNGEYEPFLIKQTAKNAKGTWRC